MTGAPRVEENGHLSEQQEAEIYRYYGIPAGGDHGSERAYGRSGDVAGRRTHDARS